MSTTTPTRRRTAANRGRGNSKAAANADCCRLCGARSAGTYRSDLRHFKTEHSRYYQGLKLRVAAPLVFLVLLGVLGTIGAPAWALIAAMAPPAAIFALGIATTRRERGLAAGPAGLLQSLKDGGWRFIIIPVAMITLIAFGRH